MQSRNLIVAAVALCLAAGVGWVLLSGGAADGRAPTTFSDDDLEVVVDEGFPPDPASAELGEDESGGRRTIDVEVGLDDPADRPDVLIEGRVLNRYGGPLGGAVVRLDFRRGFQRGGRQQQNRVRQPVATGQDGRFAFAGRGYQDLSITLQVRAEGHAPLMSDHGFENASGSLDVGDLRMIAGGGIAGQVQDLDGHGVPGATASLQPVSGNRLAWARDRAELLPPARTDAAGFYRFENLLPGAYRIEATAPRMQKGSLRDPIEVKDGVDREVETIRLGQGFALHGFVYGPDDSPVRGATVRVRNTDRRQRFDDRTQSGEDGAFEMDHLPEGPLGVEVQAKGLLTWERSDLDPSLGQQLVVHLEAGLRLTGTVVDATTGRPVERFAARCRRVGSLDRIDPTAQLAELRRQIEDVRTLARSAANAEERARHEAVAADLESHLAERSRRGPPRVKAQGQPSRPRRVPTDVGPVEDRPAGEFEFDGLDEGVYAVDISSPEHQFARSDPIEVQRDAGRSDVRVELARGISVRGVVVSRPDGAAVANAQVELSHVREDAPGARTRTTRGGLQARFDWAFTPEGPRGDTIMSIRTDDHGRFEFRHAPGGNYFLSVRHERFSDYKSDVFDLRADRDGVRLEVGSTASLHGRVSGIPPGQEGEVGVLAFGGYARMRTVKADADGRYRLDSLQPGSYLVRAFVGEQRDYLTQQMGSLFQQADPVQFDLTLAEGEARAFDPVVDVPPLGAIEGAVMINGSPARGCRVTLRADAEAGAGGGGFRFRGGGRSQSAVLDQDGRFAFRKVPAGSYVVTVTSTAGLEMHREPITVVADATRSFQASLYTGGLRGRITADDGTQAAELDGNVAILPGAVEPPADLREYGRSNRVHNVRVRDGAFGADDLTSGPALVVVQIRGRQQQVARVDVPTGASQEVVLPAGQRTDR